MKMSYSGAEEMSVRIIRESDARSEFGAAINRLFNESEIGSARLDSTPLFKEPTWRELGFPRDLWRASMLFGGGDEPSEYRRALARPWTVWMEIALDLGTREIVMVQMPLYTGDSARRTATVAALAWESIMAAGHAVDIFACDEWLVFDRSESWALRCHWEGFAILGASPAWLQRFSARYGNRAPLKRLFEECIDSEFGTEPPDDLYCQTGQAIKRQVRWPE